MSCKGTLLLWYSSKFTQLACKELRDPPSDACGDFVCHRDPSGSHGGKSPQRLCCLKKFLTQFHGANTTHSHISIYILTVHFNTYYIFTYTGIDVAVNPLPEACSPVFADPPPPYPKLHGGRGAGDICRIFAGYLQDIYRIFAGYFQADREPS